MKHEASVLKSNPLKRPSPRTHRWPAPSAREIKRNQADPLNPVRMAIARTTDQELSQMSPTDLEDLVTFSAAASDFEPFSGALDELPNSGRSGLHLKAMLARRRCRDDISAACRTRGLTMPTFAPAR